MQRRVEVVADELDVLEQLGQSLERVVLALDGDEDLLRRDEGGLALTEFALSVPIMLTLGLYGLEAARSGVSAAVPEPRLGRAGPARTPRRTAAAVGTARRGSRRRALPLGSDGCR